MRTRKQMTFRFADSESDAIRLVNLENANLSDHYRKHHPAHYTPWTSSDGKESKFIVWTWA